MSSNTSHMEGRLALLIGLGISGLIVSMMAALGIFTRSPVAPSEAARHAQAMRAKLNTCNEPARCLGGFLVRADGAIEQIVNGRGRGQVDIGELRGGVFPLGTVKDVILPEQEGPWQVLAVNHARQFVEKRTSKP